MRMTRSEMTDDESPLAGKGMLHGPLIIVDMAANY